MTLNPNFLATSRPARKQRPRHPRILALPHLYPPTMRQRRGRSPSMHLPRRERRRRNLRSLQRPKLPPHWRKQTARTSPQARKNAPLQFCVSAATSTGSISARIMYVHPACPRGGPTNPPNERPPNEMFPVPSPQGPWLQLPIELLESLLVLNMDPATLQSNESFNSPSSSSAVSSNSLSRGALLQPPTPRKSRSRDFSLLSENSPLASPGDSQRIDSPHLYPPLLAPHPGKASPPPIDPGVFRCVAGIRRLIDEAADLAVRASSGLSAAALGAMRGGGGGGSGPMGGPLFGDATSNGGRNVAMSATRIHRLRMMAVQKLAAAYKYDEVASSVMVMQGGSVFDDLAERVLKVGMSEIEYHLLRTISHHHACRSS